MKKILKLLFSNSTETSADTYLANSISLEDLERRQKLISRGEAPFQKYIKFYGASY